jgi:hypothetical protein
MSLIPIPKLYWDTFMLVVKQNSEKLAREIADVLGESPSPLIASIRNNTVGVYIYDEAANSEVDIEAMRCKHYVQCPDAPLIYVPCMNPIIWSSTPGFSMDTCVEHSKIDKSKPVKYQDSEYIQCSSTEKMILHDSVVYTNESKIVGRYMANGKLIRFKPPEK